MQKFATFLRIQLSVLEQTSAKVFLCKPVSVEFHISREARLKYQFHESLFSANGNVIFPNYHYVRIFAQKMNDKRDLINFPENAVRAGEINALGLIDEILHFVVQLYRQQKNKDVMEEALKWLEKEIGKNKLDRALHQFVEEFPPLAVHRKQKKAEEYLQDKTGDVSNREVAFEELVLLWLANLNPAFSPYLELFDDTNLEKHTAYPIIFQALHTFFDHQPHFGPDNENLIDTLRAPARKAPYSLSGQLEFIRKKWGLFLGKYLFGLLSGLDLIREEQKAGFMAGPGPALVHEFRGLEAEPERFSPDKDWMPQMVLIAKSTHVWLDQLSKKYRRPIARLDQIPDEELEELARWGFTGLWLIGLWERSQASRRIKQRCGNPEAVASAYSVYDYEIAGELGGEEAFQNLKSRAWQRGIRMCGDMVPNHMAIDSHWVIHHPDWFISLNNPPYPSHSFNGPNLSWDERVGIFLEDHYYNRSDAAVEFKRVDFYTGDTKYIYHGNDGTGMPWNDTAQLNYLNPEVREAVIETIIKVARKFPIIRFDAAMTLSKKHYRRLWFPEPGSGGDIPTRAEHGMSRPDFDAAMPQEFWREVVDRVAAEAPDTLLLAEAFWLMEGYFVRSLGMHRVYNSAFMNMLKKEENANYRTSIKNVLEFNPEILKRFVNFMNNPDEETAVAQFGKDDKYIGVCLMMVTMPGLPMFGHGQIEGFTEKYGMEYKKAYLDEQPDTHLVRRHEQEIFPVMRKRYLFAEVQNFYLYDFYASQGYVNEDVFAYSNGAGGERALVVYHNRYASASGWIKTSVASSVKTRNSDERRLEQRTLGGGLGLHNNERYFVIFKDRASGLEFIRSSKACCENGLYVELGAYQYQLFMDFREVEDNAWHHYANLNAFLNGRGVPDINEALKETFLQPIHHPFKELVNSQMFRELLAARVKNSGDKIEEITLNSFTGKMTRLLEEIKNFNQGSGNAQDIANRIGTELEAALQIPVIEKRLKCPASQHYKQATALFKRHFQKNESHWYLLFAWLVVHRLGEVVSEDNFAETSRSGLDEWLLNKLLKDTFADLGFSEIEIDRASLIVKILTYHQKWWNERHPHQPAYSNFRRLLKNSDVQNFLQVNRYRDVLWLHHESFRELMEWLNTIAILDTVHSDWKDSSKACARIKERYALIRQFILAEEKSEYQVNKLLEMLQEWSY